MSAAVKDLVAELEQRAGASDRDRALWLAERAQGITATEVRDLYLRRITVAGLIAKKLAGPEPELTGGYIKWGRTREPVIAAVIESIYPALLPESRVFHAADNARFLGSPDGVGVVNDALVVSEIKTSKYPIGLGSDTEAKKGYQAQMTWVMRVTGARRCLYAWELHDDVFLERANGEYEPEPVGLVPVMEWLDYDEALAKQLETIAVGFLVALDAAKAGDVAEIDEELDTLALNYLRGLEVEKEGKALKEVSYRSIIEIVDAGESVVQESSLARVSWSPEVVEEKPVVELDQVRAKAAAPAGLYERLEQAEDDLRQAKDALEREQQAVTAHEAAFRVEVRTERVVVKKAALRVTAAKGTKEAKS